MTRVRVLIADDHGVVRTGLRALLASDPSIEVIADVADADAAVERSSGATDVSVAVESSTVAEPPQPVSSAPAASSTAAAGRRRVRMAYFLSAWTLPMTLRMTPCWKVWVRPPAAISV